MTPRLWLSLSLAALIAASPAARAQERQQGGEIDVVQVRPNVYMLAGAGANIVVHLGWMGAVVVDTGSPEMSDRVLAAIRAQGRLHAPGDLHALLLWVGRGQPPGQWSDVHGWRTVTPQG